MAGRLRPLPATHQLQGSQEGEGFLQRPEGARRGQLWTNGMRERKGEREAGAGRVPGAGGPQHPPPCGSRPTWLTGSMALRGLLPRGSLSREVRGPPRAGPRGQGSPLGRRRGARPGRAGPGGAGPRTGSSLCVLAARVRGPAERPPGGEGGREGLGAGRAGGPARGGLPLAGCELGGRARRWARQNRQPVPAPPRAPSGSRETSGFGVEGGRLAPSARRLPAWRRGFQVQRKALPLYMRSGVSPGGF